MTDQSIRKLATARSAAGKEAEPVPPLPEPMAVEPRGGLRRGKERAARYAENLADLAAAIAFGAGTKSLHTRGQMAQLLWAMMQEVPDSVPVPPEVGRED